ncbi:MAG: histidine--tRNA ligase [Chloroflexi bacterium]|nr:histidine--tRNA ligase [Chloroflexota bacterium]
MVETARSRARFHAPTGTRDILPEEQPAWQRVREEAACLARAYGYQPVDTPVIEETGLFVRTVGEGTDIVDKEMYTFRDRGGTSLTLRPEGTAPVCRAYLEHGMRQRPQPVKLYYFASIFRYDRPQAGRYRQHHQFGFEAIGEADPALDAEVVEMAWRFYEMLGLHGLTLVLNSIGDATCRPAYLQVLKAYFASRLDRLCDDCRARFSRNPLRLLDCKSPGCQDGAEGAPASGDHLCSSCNAHFATLRTSLDDLGVPYLVNHRLVRGLDYYTRTVFEIQPAVMGGQSTLGGGGRYDGLIEELGGPSTPALGFATGLERIILELQRQQLLETAESSAEAYVAWVGAGPRRAALQLASRLRTAGRSTLLGYGDRSLKSQLRQAGAMGVRYAFILGEEELASSSVALRDLAQGEQWLVTLDGAVAALDGGRAPGVAREAAR